MYGLYQIGEPSIFSQNISDILLFANEVLEYRPVFEETKPFYNDFSVTTALLEESFEFLASLDIDTRLEEIRPRALEISTNLHLHTDWYELEKGQRVKDIEAHLIPIA